MNKVAILNINGKTFTYYEDDDDEIIINRKNADGTVSHNPDWDIDILTEDIPFSEIVYLDRSYANIYIKEKDFRELWDDMFGSKRSPINSDAVIAKIKAYLDGEN